MTKTATHTIWKIYSHLTDLKLSAKIMSILFNLKLIEKFGTGSLRDIWLGFRRKRADGGFYVLVGMFEFVPGMFVVGKDSFVGATLEFVWGIFWFFDRIVSFNVGIVRLWFTSLVFKFIGLFDGAGVLMGRTGGLAI